MPYNSTIRHTARVKAQPRHVRRDHEPARDMRAMAAGYGANSKHEEHTCLTHKHTTTTSIDKETQTNKTKKTKTTTIQTNNEQQLV